MKFVVTGALGHIGSRLIRALAKAYPQCEVVMIDNLLTQRYCSLFNLPPSAHYKLIEQDLLEVDLLPIVTGAEAVFHLAAITDAVNSFKNKAVIEKVNLGTTIKVATACAKVDCPLIHLSSTSVYGTQNHLVDEDCAPEELQPQSPYAEIKLKEESSLCELSASSGLRFVTFRCGTICGASPGMRFHTAVNKFCWQAVHRQPITVWQTALHQKRPYLDLEDAVRALLHAIDQQLYDRQIYNVLTANLTVNDLTTMVGKVIPDIQIEFVDSPIMNQLSYEVRNDKFRKLGFQFVGDTQERIKDTIRLLSNG